MMLCKNCGRQFYSDCADICQRCFLVRRDNERRAEELIVRDKALIRIKDFPLKIELVPESTWGRNLRSSVSREDWDRLRYKTYREGGYRCRICGRESRDRLYCHEIWEYNDAESVQKLIGLEAVCELCHRVHHIGLAHIQLSKAGYNEVIRHYRRINRCSYEDFWIARDKAEDIWIERSCVDWSLDFGDYSGLVKVLPG